MKLLLDTHALLWFVAGDQRLSPRARRAMESDEVKLFVSAATVWEMAIKLSLNRLELPAPLGEYIDEKLADGFQILPIDWTHAAAVEKLPFHHRDPFDRLLIAQSTLEELPLVSSDSAFRNYGIKLVW